MRVVVLGAGVGGQLAARGIKDNFSDLEVISVGSPNLATTGLFYFNKKIPGIAEKEVPVEYSKIGHGDFKMYQKKSRGEVDPSIKISSFDKVGKIESGYLKSSNEILRDDIVQLARAAVGIDLENKLVYFDDQVAINYDFLVSTIPLKVFMITTGVEMTDKIRSRFKSYPIYERVTPSSLKAADLSREVDSIKVYYDLDPDSPFYRHSSFYHGDGILKMTSESIFKIESPTNIVATGKIFPSKKLTSVVARYEETYPNITILGRYARWDYHYTVDQTYFDSIEFIKERI